MHAQREFVLPTNPTIKQAEAQRDQAMAVVEEHAGEDWQDYALSVISKVAMEHAEFTSDEVMVFLEWKPHDCRALGPAIRKACTLGIIKPTDRFRPSLRRHCSPIRVWEKGSK